MSPPLPGGITNVRIISGITSSPGLTRNLGTGNSPNWCRPNFYNQGRRHQASKTAPRFPILTGVRENAILRNISGHLPMVFIVFHCFRRQVSTFFAPVTDFLDTCRVGLGVKAIFGEGIFPQNPSNCGKKHPQLAGFAGCALSNCTSRQQSTGHRPQGFGDMPRKNRGRPRGKAGECK